MNSDLENTIKELKAASKKTGQPIWKTLSEELADKEAELIATGTTPQRRALLLSQLVELRDKVKLAERDIHYARVERDRERERLAQLQRRDPPW